MKIRLSSRVLPAYVATYLRTDYSREKLKLESVGSTMDNLNAQILGRMSVPCPPLAEQVVIMDAVSLRVAGVDSLVYEAEDATKLLRQRRAALISAAVTGKIDVRSFAPSPAP